MHQQLDAHAQGLVLEVVIILVMVLVVANAWEDVKVLVNLHVDMAVKPLAVVDQSIN